MRFPTYVCQWAKGKTRENDALICRPSTSRTNNTQCQKKAKVQKPKPKPRAPKKTAKPTKKKPVKPKKKATGKKKSKQTKRKAPRKKPQKRYNNPFAGTNLYDSDDDGHNI